MLSIMKVIIKILFKRKQFIVSTFLLPLALIVIMSSLESGNSIYNIGVINKDQGDFGKVIEKRLEDSDVIKVINLEDNDYTEELIYHKYEMIVTIDSDFTEKIINGELSLIKYKTLNEDENASVVKNLISGQVFSLLCICNNIDVEKEGIDNVVHTFYDSKPDFEDLSVGKRKSRVSNSIGLIFYIIFIASSMSCIFLLEDDRLGTKNRTIMGKVNEKEYYGAHITVYLLLGIIPALEYFILCNVLDMEFGFENKILLLVITMLVSLLSVTFNVFISSIVKSKSVYSLISSCFTIPMFMLSGCFWPYDVMGEKLQQVGNIFPTRWLLVAFENLQKGYSFVDIIPNLLGIVLLSILFFILSVYFTKNKLELIKNI